MKALFICNINKHRSPTAAALFAGAWETRDRGLYGGKELSQEDIDWADMVFVMDSFMEETVAAKFDVLPKKPLVNLHIDDTYARDSPELKERLLRKMRSLAADGVVPNDFDASR